MRDELGTKTASHITPRTRSALRPPLRALIKSWFEVLSDYIEAGEDLPYRFRERPNVGLLAAAAWRADLRVVAKGRTMVFEAKSSQRVIRAADVLDASSSLTRAGRHLKAARADAKRTEKGAHGTDHIGIVFWQPRIRVASLKGRKEEVVRASPGHLLAHVGDLGPKAETSLPTFWAAYFPPVQEVLRHEHDGYLYPGVFLFGRSGRASRG